MAATRAAAAPALQASWKGLGRFSVREVTRQGPSAATLPHSTGPPATEGPSVVRSIEFDALRLDPLLLVFLQPSFDKVQITLSTLG